jgi:hypothetical protein
MRTSPEDRWIKGILFPIPYLVLTLLIVLFGLPLYSFISAPLKAIVLLGLLYGGFILLLSKILSYTHQKLLPLFPLFPQRRKFKAPSTLHTTLEWERIRRDIRYSVRKRNYFHRILRPQLLDIIQQKLQNAYGLSRQTLQSHPPPTVDVLLREFLMGETLFQGRRVTLAYLQTLLTRIEEL